MAAAYNISVIFSVFILVAMLLTQISYRINHKQLNGNVESINAFTAIEPKTTFVDIYKYKIEILSNPTTGSANMTATKCGYNGARRFKHVL